MNKKLLVAAVAAALAAPTVVLAQTTVTMTGKVHVTFGQISISQSAATGRKSQIEVKDESSAVRFLMREDLGGGLAAIAKFDLRMSPDAGAAANSGESYVGLTSKNWGTIHMGRTDLHYGKHGSFTGAYATLWSNPVAVFDYAGRGANRVAAVTRTDNTVRYGSPKWGNMFELNVAYSSNPTNSGAAEAELKSTASRGDAWNINPVIYGSNWQAEYSYWRARGEAGGNVNTAAGGVAAANAVLANQQRGDSINGWMKFGGLRVGLAWNRSRLETAAGVETSRRTTWGVPIAYEWGSHHIFGDIYRAGNDRIIGANTKANFLGLTYAYDLSKRTSIAVNHTRITNQAAASYMLFTGAGGAALAVGEDPRTTNVSLNHRF